MSTKRFFRGEGPHIFFPKRAPLRVYLALLGAVVCYHWPLALRDQHGDGIMRILQDFRGDANLCCGVSMGMETNTTELPRERNFYGASASANESNIHFFHV